MSVFKWNTMDEMLNYLSEEKDLKNEVILNAFIKLYQKLNRVVYNNVMVSVSGGSDSDIILDMCYRCDVENKCRYVWFDTGLEFQATKKHLKYLESKYNINIERVRPGMPIPKSCKQYGQPFISKDISQKIYYLQKGGFKFEDKEYEELIEEYPNIAVYLLKWWCNIPTKEGVDNNRFLISSKKYLKEFIVENKPWFLISDKCCTKAKKQPSKKYEKENNIELKIMGIRKAEGGVRSTAYKSCFVKDWFTDLLMPAFWFKEHDKVYYEEMFDIKHSDCYEVYGFKRTGCAACPFAGIDGCRKQLMTLKKYEKNLYNAVKNVFGDAYEYTKMYYGFVEQRKWEDGKDK